MQKAASKMEQAFKARPPDVSTHTDTKEARHCLSVLVIQVGFGKKKKKKQNHFIDPSLDNTIYF